MYNWNLVILFGVGGGLFLFFSSCFCYYKRLDIIRRRAEKIYENEREGIYNNVQQQRAKPKVPVNSPSEQGHSSGSSSSQTSTATPDTISSTMIEMHACSTAESVSNSSGDFESQRFNGKVSQARVNEAFDITEC